MSTETPRLSAGASDREVATLPRGRILEVRGLEVSFTTLDGVVAAVRGVDLAVDAGETLGIVGETGCGKSVACSALMGLIPTPPGRVHAEVMAFKGVSLLEGGRPSPARMRELRGTGISMIFQDPGTALNPVFPVGDPLRATIRRHHGVGEAAARERALEWLERVRLQDGVGVAKQYPHQLSGGMKQRVAIAMALSPHPALVIADEPTTALDVTVQAQILDLLASLQAESGIGMIFISHDLGVMARISHRVAVMYAGRVVEETPVGRLFAAPAHPYTRGLLAARPQALRRPARGMRPRLAAIPGTVPPPSQVPVGCPFHPRCSRAEERCRAEPPSLETVADGHRAACFFPILEPLPESRP